MVVRDCAPRATEKVFRRLKVRYERRADVHQAFLELSCALNLLE